MDIKLIFFKELTNVTIRRFNIKESYLKYYSRKKSVLIILLFFLFIFIKYYAFKLLKEKLNEYSIGKQFIDKCLKIKNISNYSHFYDSPKFSVVIPVYNCENSIYYPINSIQNQNISEYEIILINDFSTDQSLKIIQSFIESDKRIKIINNKENKGTLYSRCIGTLMSKGKYIFPLDNDDLIFGEDVFDYLYKINKKNECDIVGFKAVQAESYIDDIYKMKDLIKYKYKNNLTVLQPELGIWLITEDGKFYLHDVTIWGKIIKSTLYINAINLLGKNRYSTYMSWAEDTSMNCVIFNIANSFKFIHKYGIFHINSNTTASYTQSINNHFFGELFLSDIIYDFSIQNHNKIFSLLFTLEILKRYYNKKASIKENSIQYLNKIILKILKCKFINVNNKNKLINLYHKFLF